MNQRIRELAEQAEILITEAGAFHNTPQGAYQLQEQHMKKFAELIVRDMHRKVIASILITDVVMEEKGLTPTSEDYIRAINKDFGVE
jgi:hypothetical protein